MSISTRGKPNLERRQHIVYELLQPELHARYLGENSPQRHLLGLSLERRLRHWVDDLGCRCRDVANTSVSSQPVQAQ